MTGQNAAAARMAASSETEGTKETGGIGLAFVTRETWQIQAAAIAGLTTISKPWYWDWTERAIAGVLLLLSLPVQLVVALLVRLDSPGPILFGQWRVGRGGRLFRFTKFRTYYADAADRFPKMYSYQYNDEEIERLCFKIPNDPRATRMGRWLRETTLDELPNFWHVFTGEMSLVGPRPEIPQMLPYYAEADLVKFTVKPGITGISQISGRGWLTFRKTVRLDVEYVRTQNIRTDVKILFLTLYRVLLKQGAF